MENRQKDSDTEDLKPEIKELGIEEKSNEEDMKIEIKSEITDEIGL